MLKQKDIVIKTSNSTLTYAEMGDIVCNSASAIQITLPSPNSGLWYRISNVGIWSVTVLYNGTVITTLSQKEQRLFLANGTSSWFLSNEKSSMTKPEIENILTGVISSHSHDMGSIFYMNETFTEDFETAEPILARTGTWVVTSDAKISGSASLRSNKASTATFTFETEAPTGELSFYYKIGTEAGYDKFYARIDGVAVINGISGVKEWTKYTQQISAGLHTLQFQYTKDGSGDRNGDTCYVDLISYAGDDKVYFHDITDHTNIAKMLGESGSIVKVNSTEDGLDYIKQNDLPFLKKITGSALPTASEEYRGQIFTLLGDIGIADTSYICIKNASDTYEWLTI